MGTPEQRSTILIVDDSPNDIRLMGKILSADHHVLFATNGQEAMECATANPPDLILLDIMMPDIDGFTVCSRLRDNKDQLDIPVIIFTEINNPEAETRGFEAGAVDFLTKPVNPPSVRARVAVHLALKKQRNALEKEIRERKHLEIRLRELAELDPLTRLPNRKLFDDRLRQAILMSERNQRDFALLFVDLDRFKWVNDTLGHDAGDALLVDVASRLKNLVRKSDTVARMGGDEFTVILTDIVHESMVELVARKILEQLTTPFRLKGQEVVISGSVGIGLFPGDGATAEELAKNADCAMYQAKASGRNAFQFFSPEINAQAYKRMHLESDMRQACQRNEFFLDYQPKINLTTGRICGMEALLRWDHPRDGILFPHQFIPLAEGTGMILQIGTWVLRSACQDATYWRNHGFPGLKLAVNLSALQFRDGDKLVELLQEILHDTGFPPHNLELEITETMMMNNTEQVCATLQKITAMGISIAMDDFGTGYSSLALLRRLPIQVIKIDRSFVSDLKEGSANTAFIAAIVSMARQLHLHVVVEGVETAEQLQIMKTHGGDDVQGFYFSPPLGKEGFLALMQGRIPLGGGMYPFDPPK
ncbi:MAG: EAL domain-containing protein [Magnetococcales bacterium]|nr:EAL domain-containing protein [Magnetococcales bacterium]